MAHYGFKPISGVEPDSNGQDDWKYSVLLNPRSQSFQAKQHRIERLLRYAMLKYAIRAKSKHR